MSNYWNIQCSNLVDSKTIKQLLQQYHKSQLDGNIFHILTTTADERTLHRVHEKTITLYTLP